MDLEGLEIVARPVGHLPLVRAVVGELGLLDVIEAHCPRHPLNRVSDAECVLAMLLNVLCGRPALYRMDQWLGRLDVDVLFGEGVEADAFHDTRLGEALDHLDEVGTDTILFDIAQRYLLDHPEPFSAHHDTTSVSVFGAYDGDADPQPLHGFSKDHRPDLKQLIYGLTLHGAAGVPLVATVDAGNTADSTVARDHLASLVNLLPDEREVTLVGDCKLVDKHTLGRVLRAGLHFVSLVPNTFNVRRDLIAQACADRPDVEAWPELAEKPGRRQADPAAYYRGFSYVRPLHVLLEDDEGQGPHSIEELRFLVVWSDKLAKKFDASLDQKLAKEAEKLQTGARLANRKPFGCEADARAAADRIIGKSAYHAVAVNIECTVVPVRRPRPGRPRNGEVRETQEEWRFTLQLDRDEERIRAARKHAGCFVLVTDWFEDQWADKRVLNEYRHQHLIEGHTGFRWLKGPAAVAPIFLKTPGRIRAMGLVLILGLFVRNFLQGTIRSRLEERGETLPHPFTRKEEPSLTPEMAFEHFGGLLTRVVSIGEATKRMPVQLTTAAERILALFDLNQQIFQPPMRRSEKLRGRSPPTPGM